MTVAADTCDFLRRASGESLRYGGDDWVFLRELGQNARDAGARKIEVCCRLIDGQQQLVFRDDGCGMSLEHARAFLFRLYASSKEGEARSAGRYGVGFWSVLRFGPSRIEVHSCDGRSVWAVALSGDLSGARRITPRRSTRGTEIVLLRPADGAAEDAFRARVAEELGRSLGHLRTATRRARALPVWLDGRRIDRPLSLPGPGTLAFSQAAVEGVVGLGPQPHFRLLARGLPVAEGALLEELEGLRLRRREPVGRRGLAPVYLLNGNRLEVVLSRQTVVRDRALERLLTAARSRFDELVEGAIDGAVARSRPERLGALGRRLGRGFGRAPLALRLLLLALCLAGIGALGGAGAAGWLGTLSRSNESVPLAAPDAVATADSPAVVPRPLSASAPVAMPLAPTLRPEDLSALAGGTVSPPGADPDWDLVLDSPQRRLLRLAVLERFDPKLGWRAGPQNEDWRAVSYGPPGSGLQLTLRLPPGGGEQRLPLPVAAQPSGPARLDGREVQLEACDRGLLRLRLPPGHPGGVLHYRVLEGQGGPAGGFGRQERVPRLRLPVALAAPLRELRSLDAGHRLGRSLELVRRLVRSERSREVAEAYRRMQSAAAPDWLAGVLQIGAGDCDVLNGLLVLLLRLQGIPARLAVGLVAEGGGGAPGLHAWAEVWEAGRLVVLDASEPTRPVSARPEPLVADAVPTQPVPVRSAPVTAEAEPRASPTGRAAVPTALRNPGWVAAGGGVFLVLLALAVLLAAARGARSGRLRLEAGEAERRHLLADMVADVLRRPAAWRSVPGIWRRAFLPCLVSGRVSLEWLVRQIEFGRVFVGRRDDPLLEAAHRARVVVLDEQDPDFGPLLRRLAGVRELASLSRLRPTAQPVGEAGKLLRELNGWLRKCGAVQVRPVAVSLAGPFRDVDLGPLRPGDGLVRYLAVDLDHSWWRSAATAFLRAPGPALSAVVDRLAAESALLKSSADRLRRRVALAALEDS